MPRLAEMLMTPVSKAMLLLGAAAMAASPTFASALVNNGQDEGESPFLCGDDDGEQGDEDDLGRGLCGLEIFGIAGGVLALGLVMGGSSKSN